MDLYKEQDFISEENPTESFNPNKDLSAYDMYDYQRLFEPKELDNWTWTKIGRVKVKASKNVIVPDMTSKIEKYRPLNFFSTIDSDNTNFKENVLTDFLSVNTEKYHTIEKFTQKYGYLHIEVKENFFDFITDIDGNPLNFTNVPFFAEKVSLSSFIEEHKKLNFIVSSYQLIKADNVDINKIVAEAKKHLHLFNNDYLRYVTYYGSEDFVEIFSVEETDINGNIIPISTEKKDRKLIVLYILHFIKEELWKRIKDNVISKPYVDSHNEQIKEGWYFKDLITSLYYQFYIAIRDRKRLKKCVNPKCPNYFFVYNEKQVFCCTQCGKNHYTNLSREKVRLKMNKE